MIAAGLSWRMAIGACVLGNTIMGLVITTNGRMGATVRKPFHYMLYRDKLTLPVAACSVPSTSSYAVRVLLQLLCRCITLCSRYHLAWVSLNTACFRRL